MQSGADLWGFAPGSIKPNEVVYGTSVAASLLGVSSTSTPDNGRPQLQRPWTSHETLRIPSTHPASTSMYAARPLSRLHGFRVRDLAASHAARLRTRRADPSSMDTTDLCAEADPNLAAPLQPETDIFGGQPITDLGSTLSATSSHGTAGKQVAKYLSNVWRENRNREAAGDRLERHVKHLVDQWSGQMGRLEEERVRRQETMMHTRSRLPWRGSDIAPEAIRPHLNQIKHKTAKSNSDDESSEVKRFMPLAASPEVVAWRGDVTEDLESYYKSDAWSVQSNTRQRWPQVASDREQLSSTARFLTVSNPDAASTTTTVVGSAASVDGANSDGSSASTTLGGTKGPIQLIDVFNTSQDISNNQSATGLTSLLNPQNKPTALAVLQSQAPSLDPQARIASMSPYRPLSLNATLSGHIPRPNLAGHDTRPKPTPKGETTDGINVRWSEVDIGNAIQRSAEKANQLPPPKIISVVGSLPPSAFSSNLAGTGSLLSSTHNSASLTVTPATGPKSLVPTTGKPNYRALLGASDAAFATSTPSTSNDPEVSGVAWGSASLAVLQAKARAANTAASAAAAALASGEGGENAESLAASTAAEAAAANKALAAALASAAPQPADTRRPSTSASQFKAAGTQPNASVQASSKQSSTTTKAASSAAAQPQSVEQTSTAVLQHVAAPPAGVRRSFTARCGGPTAATTTPLTAFAQTPVVVLEQPPLPPAPKPAVAANNPGKSSSATGSRTSMRSSMGGSSAAQQQVPTIDPNALKSSYELLPPRPATAPEFATRAALIAAQQLAKRQELVECETIKSKLAQHDVHISRAVLERALVAPVITFSPAERSLYAPPMSNLSSNPSLVVQPKQTKKKKTVKKSGASSSSSSRMSSR